MINKINKMNKRSASTSAGMSKATIVYTLIAIMLTGFISAQSLLYAKTYKANGNKRINIEISQTGVNRIEVKKDRIAKVIGNTDEYSIEGDGKTGVIFISAKGIAGEMIPITIITEKGYTQDINLKVKKASEPKTVIIEKPVIKGVKAREKAVQNIKEKVIEAIRDITKGEDRNFTKREISHKEIANYRKQQSPTGNFKANLVFKVKIQGLS